ncbi:uncharacterized protein I303_101408 [Kwoniella dejecticola CBS 10117]|uniref:Uncharacterized protein n=1 Tax=Kwoniella dejecticola CBS 10117 TaxID=1296121 RepID=A0A1A6AHU6_9TREE|nr:uncharacterized protein I303_01417 [Kwoniella dejecticola CBS 10117]OBR89588.1 hypothetical protein I303_01417 [Kwoniella dejecticola CBS 10117]
MKHKAERQLEAGQTTSSQAGTAFAERPAHNGWDGVQLSDSRGGDSIGIRVNRDIQRNKGHWATHGLLAGALVASSAVIGYQATSQSSSSAALSTDLEDCKADNQTFAEKAQELAENLMEAQGVISDLNDTINGDNGSSCATQISTTMSATAMTSDTMSSASPANTDTITVTTTPTLG